MTPVLEIVFWIGFFGLVIGVACWELRPWSCEAYRRRRQVRRTRELDRLNKAERYTEALLLIVRWEEEDENEGNRHLP